jgi:sugar phosphate isomerase/epimerase
MMNKEQGSITWAVSRMTLGFKSDRRAFETLAQINEKLSVPFGLETVPHRLVTAPGLRELSRQFGIKIIGVHGPLQPKPQDLLKISLANLITKKPRDVHEAILDLVWLVGFGTLKEPRCAKRYGSCLDLAQKLNAYLVMHQEPLEAMGQQLTREWAAKIRILRENGWGPADGLMNPLSWDPQEIKKATKKLGIGTLLDTSAAARAGQDILMAYEVMQPEAIHLSDYSVDNTGRPWENLIPGTGLLGPQLKELVQEVRRRRGVVVVLEIRTRNLDAALDGTLNYLEGGSSGCSRGI